MKTGSTPAKRQLKENEGELKVSEVKTATASTCPDNVSPKPESIDMMETAMTEAARAKALAAFSGDSLTAQTMRTFYEDAYLAGAREALGRADAVVSAARGVVRAAHGEGEEVLSGAVDALILELIDYDGVRARLRTTLNGDTRP